MKKKIIISISVIVLIVAAVLVKNFVTTRNINNKDLLAEKIKAEENLDSVKVRKTVKNKNMVFVLYEDSKKQIGLAILKNEGVILKRYTYFGGTSPNEYSYGTYNTSDPKKTIIVVLGNNNGDGERYEFKAYGKTYTEDISKQKDILKVYWLTYEDTKGKNTYDELIVYDKNNNEIDLYK